MRSSNRNGNSMKMAFHKNDVISVPLTDSVLVKQETSDQQTERTIPDENRSWTRSITGDGDNGGSSDRL